MDIGQTTKTVIFEPIELPIEEVLIKPPGSHIRHYEWFIRMPLLSSMTINQALKNIGS